MRVDQGRIALLVVSGLLVVFVLVGGILGNSLAVEGTYAYLKLFNEVLYLIRNNYVEPVKDEVLMEGAYRGMLENLDPQSEYLTAAEFRRAERGERRGPADVGVVLSKLRGYAIIVVAEEGSPADRASLGTGDRIVTIDRRSTLGMGVWEATQSLQGKTGSAVHLSVVREGGSNREEVDLTRQLPTRARITHRILEPGVGYLRPGTLAAGDVERVRRTLQTLQGQDVRRLVLDLRANADSELGEAVKTAGLFTGEGRIVTIADRQQGKKEMEAPPGAPVWTGPVVVVVNTGTAGAAEALAAAVRDRTGGSLVGVKTWGWGSLQKVIPLPGGDGLRLSVGKFLSPEGREWNGSGLSPDVEQEAGSEKVKGEDLQIQRALEVLKQPAGGRKVA